MKKCDKCKRPSVETTRESKELCIKHYSSSSDNEEEEIKTKDKEKTDDYIL